MKNARVIFQISLTSCALLLGCENDEVARRKAEAIPSFDSSWSFVDADFAYEKNGLLSISFSHIDKDPLIAHEILFRDISPTEGTFRLMNAERGSGLPTSRLFVVQGGDVLRDTYSIDSTASLESFLTIDCITKNKITGQFQLNYIRDSGGQSSYGLPGSFSLSEGKFDARR
jgi:hypothetical protein